MAADRNRLIRFVHPATRGDSRKAPSALASLAAVRGESPATLRKTVSRMRHSFRQHMKAQLAPALAKSADLDDAMRALLAALSA